MSAYAIELSNITFSYDGETDVLKGLDFQLPFGQFAVLQGISGTGKTTLLSVINGVIPHIVPGKMTGTVYLSGEDATGYSVGKRSKFIGSVLQNAEDQIVHDRVEDEVAFGCENMGMPTEEIEKRVAEALQKTNLKPDRSTRKLSGGQKKRLSISIEFISNPSLFILDEPDSGLDGVMARELFVQLRKIADTGKIVIVITHTPDRVIDLFDDVIVLAKDSARTGRLAYYGSIEDARKFFGRDTMEQIVKSVNRKEEGGDGLADDFVLKYAGSEGSGAPVGHSPQEKATRTSQPKQAAAPLQGDDAPIEDAEVHHG